MSDTTFVDQTTIVPAAWLNDVDKSVYRAIGTGVGGVAPQTPAEVVTNLGLHNTTGASNIGYIQAGAGAVATDLQTRGGQEVWVTDFMTAEMKADVAAGTLLVDCQPAFVAAIASFPTNMDYFSISLAGTLRVPRGKFRMASTLPINRVVRMIGETGAMPNDFGATQLWFDDQIDGIVAEWYANLAGQKMGAGMILENMFIGCNRPQNTFPVVLGTGHGIRAQCPVILKNLWVYGFRQNGVILQSDFGGNPGSVDVSYIEKVASTNNSRHGFFIEGGDSNVITSISCQATHNGGCGIFDSSFLGNTHIGCHTSDNGYLCQVSVGGTIYSCMNETLGPTTTPGTNEAVWETNRAGAPLPQWPAWVLNNTYLIGNCYRSDNVNARTVFLGCYSEGGQARAHIINPAQFIGGTNGSGFSTGTTGMLLNVSAQQQYAAVGVVSQSRAGFPSPPTSDRVFVSKHGFAAGTNQADTIVTTGDNTSGFSLRTWNETSGCWITQHGLQTARIPVYYTTDLTTLTAGRVAPVSPGQIMFPQGIFVGGRSLLPSTTNLRMIGNQAGTGNPASGNYGVGDILFNTTPASAGFMGITCTVQGTMGTLNGGATTATTTIGTTAVTLSSATGAAVGQFITIVGVAGIKCIVALSGVNATIDTNASASVVGAAVAFSAATFKTFGLIS